MKGEQHRGGAAEEVARDAPWWHTASREARPEETFARRRNFLFPSAQGGTGGDAALQRSPEGELNQDLVSSSVGRPTSLGSAIASAGILPPSHRDRLRSWLARRGVSLEDAEDAIGPQELEQIRQIQSLLRQLEQRANPGSGRPEVERELATGQSGMAGTTMNAAPSDGANGRDLAEPKSAESAGSENADGVADAAGGKSLTIKGLASGQTVRIYFAAVDAAGNVMEDAHTAESVLVVNTVVDTTPPSTSLVVAAAPSSCWLVAALARSAPSAVALGWSGVCAVHHGARCCWRW